MCYAAGAKVACAYFLSKSFLCIHFSLADETAHLPYLLPVALLACLAVIRFASSAEESFVVAAVVEGGELAEGSVATDAILYIAH